MSLRPQEAEVQADLDHGRVVIVTARWLLIVVGLFLLVVKPTSSVPELRLQVALILLLGLANFVLHAQMLKRRPLSRTIAYVASGADLLVVTILVLSQGGDSPIFVLYFPALVALSVAFEPVVTTAYTLATAAVYGAIAAAELPGGAQVAPIVLTRILMLVAVAVCGGLYWSIEHERRSRTERSLS
jgi:hypothetical protein